MKQAKSKETKPLTMMTITFAGLASISLFLGLFPFLEILRGQEQGFYVLAGLFIFMGLFTC